MKKIKFYKNFIFCEYKNFDEIINNLHGKNFSIDELTCSISNEKIIKSKFRIKSLIDPCYGMKSIKNSLISNYHYKAAPVDEETENKLVKLFKKEVYNLTKIGVDTSMWNKKFFDK